MTLIPRHLYTQLVMIVMLIVVAALLLYGFVVGQRTVSYTIDVLNDQMGVVAQNLAVSCSSYILVQDYAALDALLMQMAAMPHVTELQVFETKGAVISTVVAQHGREPRVVLDGPVRQLPLVAGVSSTIDGESITLWQPIVAGTMLGWLRIVLDTDDIRGIKRNVWASSIGVGCVIVVLSIVVVLVSLSGPIRQLREVASFARRLVGSQGEQVTMSCRAVELEELGRSLNQASHELVLREQALMAEREQLQEAHDQLTVLNEELEQRVEERTAALLNANRQLESFSYSVSHDLRAPLRTIDGFVHLVIEDFGDQLPVEARQYLERACDGARRMELLIDDLLQFARLSRQSLAISPVDMDALIREQVADCLAQQPERQVALVIGKVPPCQGDPALLRQVLYNLLSNAFKYTGACGAPRVEVGSLEREGDVVYFVRDNGVGFDMAYAEKLFGVFQRLHSADEFEGTGVGLAIVQNIVERHGGRVWAEAAVGKGATFFFTLAPDSRSVPSVP